MNSRLPDHLRRSAFVSAKVRLETKEALQDLATRMRMTLSDLIDIACKEKLVTRENHNELVPWLLNELITGVDSETDAMLVLESLILGVMLYFRPDPVEAEKFLDVMTASVIDRLGKDKP